MISPWRDASIAEQRLRYVLDEMTRLGRCNLRRLQVASDRYHAAVLRIFDRAEVFAENARFFQSMPPLPTYGEVKIELVWDQPDDDLLEKP